MPHKMTYLEDEGGLVTTYWGIVSDGEIIKSGKEKLAIKDKLKTCRYVLTDLSVVEKLNLTPHGIQVNADISLKMLKENTDILVAFVVPDDFGFGMSRMWQAYANHSDIKSRIFRTRSEAETWIRNNLKHLAD